MVYVLSIFGKPLIPCTEAKARHLLKEGKATVVRREPFTIQLKFECENQTQPVTLGVDAGAKHIGLSASTEKKRTLFSRSCTSYRHYRIAFNTSRIAKVKA